MRAVLELSFTSYLALITFSFGFKEKGLRFGLFDRSPRLNTLVEDNEGQVKLTKGGQSQRQEVKYLRNRARRHSITMTSIHGPIPGLLINFFVCFC